jgi:flagellar hook-associated protein 1 FlgK
MSLDAALGIASSGLMAVQRALAQASANVANAQTAGYTAKTLSPQALSLEGQPAGVISGVAQRAVDLAVVGQIGASTSDQAGATLRERLLTGVQDAYGSVSGVDSNSSLADDINTLRTSFITLQGSPSDTAAQRSAVNAASAVAGDFNKVGQAITTARQQAQDSMVQQVAAANAALRSIGGLSRQIQQAQVQGQSTAGLEDQRDQAVQTLAASIAVKVIRQPDGGMLVLSQGGAMLPTDPNKDALTLTPATVGPNAYYGAGGSLPGVMLGGADVTKQLIGGALGSAIELRDKTLPRYQAEADSAAGQLAYRFDQEGLTLFTTPAGTVPDMSQPYTTGGQLGFASSMQVNPAVAANPSLVRDGTRSVSIGAGGVTNFTPNPGAGPAAFTGLLDNVVTYTFGKQAAAGTGWPPIGTTGLGPDGTLSSPFNPGSTVQDYAATVESVHSADAAAAGTAKDQAAGLLATLQQRFNTQSGVSVDNEMTIMIQLQQAYAANAKVVGAVQSMWDALLGTVQ